MTFGDIQKPNASSDAVMRQVANNPPVVYYIERPIYSISVLVTL